MKWKRAYDTDETVTDDSDLDPFGVEFPMPTSIRVKIETATTEESTMTPCVQELPRLSRVKMEPSSATETIPVIAETPPPTNATSICVKIEPVSDDDDGPTPLFGTMYYDDHQMFHSCLSRQCTTIHMRWTSSLDASTIS